LAITALCFTVGCPASAQPASITAIGLSPPATPADTKASLAVTAENRNKSIFLLLPGIGQPPPVMIDHRIEFI
jgi:hypothetical protein